MNEDHRIGSSPETQLAIKPARQYYLDYAKVSAIIFMILVHVFWKLGCSFEEPVGYVINSVLGGFMTAPVFMTAMGVGFSLTETAAPSQFMHRGLHILLLAYLLNVVRDLPLAVYDVAAEGFSAMAHELLCEFLQGDILQFAGLAIFFFGVLKKLRLSRGAILAVACLMSLTGSLIPAILSDSIPLNATVGLFIFVGLSDEAIMCFPLFTWFIFPAFGYWLSGILREDARREKLFKLTLIPCFLIALAGSVTEMKYNVFMMSSDVDAYYYHMLSHDALISLCYVVFCFGLFFFISRRLSEKVNRFFVVLSDSLNLIYLIHWPLIYWIVLFMVRLGHVEFSNVNGFLISAAVAVIAVSLAVYGKKQIRSKLRRKPDSILRYLK